MYLLTSALREEKKYDKLKNVWIGIPTISYLFENHQCHMLRQSQQKVFGLGSSLFHEIETHFGGLLSADYKNYVQN